MTDKKCQDCLQYNPVSFAEDAPMLSSVESLGRCYSSSVKGLQCWLANDGHHRHFYGDVGSTTERTTGGTPHL